MASPSGTSLGSSSVMQNSGSEEDLRALMDERKRKRMISNRESARRSRMRKQKHLEDLTTQVAQLRKENHEIITSINTTAQHYMNVEAENSVMRAQASELSRRLESLNEIISYLNANNGDCVAEPEPAYSFMNPFNRACLNQPLVAFADIFQY